MLEFQPSFEEVKKKMYPVVKSLLIVYLAHIQTWFLLPLTCNPTCCECRNLESSINIM